MCRDAAGKESDHRLNSVKRLEMENLKKVRTIFKSHALRDIVHWSGCIRRQLTFICLLCAATSLFSLGIPLATKGMIDGATAGDSSALVRNGILLTAMILLYQGCSMLEALIRNRASARMQLSLQSRVTEAILGKEYASVKPFHSGELVNRIFSDVGVVKEGVIGFLPSLLGISISFIGASAILISMDWRFVPVMIVAGLAGGGMMILLRNPMKRRHKRMQAAEDSLHAVTQETLENLRVVKASVSEERAIGQMDESRERLSREQVSRGKLSVLMNHGMSGMFDLSWLICNLWGCYKIYQGSFTYGSLAALIQLVGRVQAPLANAVGLVGQAYNVIASAERLQEVLDLPQEEEGQKLESFDAIRLEDLCFHYEDGPDGVLTDVNGTIRRGDFAALTGISGGGKTSLFQLLLGIYRPTSGRVFFEQGDRQVPVSKATRSLFAYVPQGNTLRSGTVYENLTMFTDHASPEEVRNAVRAACLEDVVLEVGMDAVLGERGVGLSEGQAQRVAVARALLSKAPILLLDEATSALDEETEARMLKNISAMREKTCIIVTHRRAALSICDYTFHIENGRMTRTEGATQI